MISGTGSLPLRMRDRWTSGRFEADVGFAESEERLPILQVQASDQLRGLMMSLGREWDAAR